MVILEAEQLNVISNLMTRLSKFINERVSIHIQTNEMELSCDVAPDEVYSDEKGFSISAPHFEYKIKFELLKSFKVKYYESKDPLSRFDDDVCMHRVAGSVLQD